MNYAKNWSDSLAQLIVSEEEEGRNDHVVTFSVIDTGKTLHEALSALTDAQQEQQEQEGLVQAMQAL
jgi:hypothetical protein